MRNRRDNLRIVDSTITVQKLKGFLRKPAKPVSIEEMHDAIEECALRGNVGESKKIVPGSTDEDPRSRNS